MFRENCGLRLRFSCVPKTSSTTPFRSSTKLFISELPRASQREDLHSVAGLINVIEDPILQEIDFEELDNAIIQDPDPTPNTQKKKRGVKKGSQMKEENKIAISKAMKGKNKYKRTELHRSRVSRTMKRRWAERKALGKQRKPVQCSVCGEFGHNKQTCPHTPPSAKTKHKMPQSFEHRWKIAAGNKRYHDQIRRKQEIKPKTKPKTERVLRCGHCGQVGHNIRTCPELKKSRATNGKETNLSMTEKKSSLVPKIKMSDVEDLKSLYTVPLDVESMWKLALDCAVLAWRGGVNRQRMEFTFPTLIGGSPDVAMFSSNNVLSRQFQVAALIVESVLKGLKSQPKLSGRLEVGVLDETESAVYWEGKEIGAILFPQSQSLDMMISRGMMRRKKAPSLQLMINPQWQPGQVVSDFGFGSLRTLRENFVNSFEDVFYMKQISVFTDSVIVMRCYPSQWQVHLVMPSGKIELVGTTREKPAFEKIMSMLRTMESAVSRLSWIERLKMRYIQGRNPSTLFPLTLSKSDFQQCIQRADASIMKRVEALNSNLSKTPPSIERDSKPVEEIDRFPEVDIITGEFVRDIKLDPLKEFTSLIGKNDDL